MIHKSATKALTLNWTNGNRTTLWLGHNRNNGATIVWQVVERAGKLGRSQRITGKNIAKLADEIRPITAAEAPMDIHNVAAFNTIMGN